ncbi:MAG: hypothetical protein EPO07_19950 [Verrucomicrobia bacterium]|nr:MAG: hypothetical protein EPO07_19950 [Verrucomicrobiota bacterium]
MKQLYLRAVGAALILTISTSSYHAFCQPTSGKILVQNVTGNASYTTDGKDWLTLQPNTLLERGATIKTGANGVTDLLLQYNGSVLRLVPNSSLNLAKLNREKAGEDTITETSLQLTAGSLVGSQRKLAAPSRLDIVIPGGVATIVGTEYVVRADGAVSVLSGSVTVNYNLPGNKGDVKVTIPAGYTFDPSTGQVVPTTPAYLQNVIADINTVRNNARVFKAGGATIVIKPEGEISPTKPKGNNGVGNGIDPQPPGNPPINDGPGTGPGNPGNKGGANSRNRNVQPN